MRASNSQRDLEALSGIINDLAEDASAGEVNAEIGRLPGHDRSGIAAGIEKYLFAAVIHLYTMDAISYTAEDIVTACVRVGAAMAIEIYQHAGQRPVAGLIRLLIFGVFKHIALNHAVTHG